MASIRARLLIPVVVVVVLVGAALSADAAPDLTRIVRTDYGVAHVTGTDWTGAGFGEGWAFAQDDLCVFADDVVTLRGQRSRWFGPDAHVTDLANGLDTDNLTSDFYYQRINTSGVVRHLLDGTDPSGSPAPSLRSRQLVAGYAEGYDAYLASVGGASGVTDPTCHGAPWVGPITAMDVWDRLYQIATLTTSEAFSPDLVAAAPPGGVPAASVPLTAAASRPVGSNAWAFGSDGSTGGKGVLLGNPHFPWSGPERFWQVQLDVPGEVDVEGATLAGVPGVLIGFNHDVAWSFTVSAASAAAVYQLHLVPGKPTQYLVDGKPEAMTSQTVGVTVRNTDGTLSRRTHTFYSTRYGPVVSAAANGLAWTGANAFSLYDPNAANLRLLDTMLDVDTSTSTAGLLGALRRHEGLPWVNTIASDSGGHALFADISVMPHITDVQQASCATALGLSGAVPLPLLDGSTAACLPGRDADSVVPGIYGGAELPTMARSDYVANSNDGPWLTNAGQPMTGYPAVTADQRRPPSLRTRLSLTMIQEQLAGPAHGFDLSTVEQTALNDRNYTAEMVKSDLVQVCDRQADLAKACAVLSAWDSKDGLNDKGAVLFHEFIDAAFANGGGLTFFSDRFDPLHPVTTPHQLNMDDPALIPALETAVGKLTKAGIALDASWGDVQYVQRDGQRIPIPSSDDPGIFNVVDSALVPSAHGYPGVASGVSFLLAVEFRGDGPHASAILTYGESQNPTSPHFGDQAELYSKSSWPALPYTDAQISAAARSVVSVRPPA
jgi:acyl-homoserine-lactone acylase